MTFDTLIIGIILVMGFGGLYVLMSRKLDAPRDNTMMEWLKSMQLSLNENNTNLSSTLQRSYRDLHERLEKATEVIGELRRETGAFSEMGRSMKELQEFLKSPKLRGNIGEEVLKDLIGQMFPKNSFLMQYKFKSGETVDAAIKTEAGILPIDSKFPMENFQRMAKAEKEAEKRVHQAAFVRDMRKHVKDIASKYILPDEGTMDFALMYVPSEAVYYEMVSETEIMEYARNSRVYPVSPTTLYAHLQTILLSFEGKRIDSKSKEVFALLRSIKKDYEKLDESVGVLGRHVTNAYNQMGNTNQTMTAIGQKLSSTKTIGEGEND